MKITIDFEPSLGILAHRIYLARTSDSLPINISKAWIYQELRSNYYLNGETLTSGEYTHEDMKEAMRVNNLYELYLRS